MALEDFAETVSPRYFISLPLIVSFSKSLPNHKQSEMDEIERVGVFIDNDQMSTGIWFMQTMVTVVSMDVSHALVH
jgi:hypothetical protein